MERAREKITVISIIAACTTLYVVGINNIPCSSSWWARFVYSFFHVSIWHLLVNAWALWNMTSRLKIRISELLIAYLVSTVVPAINMVGLSVIIFTIMGLRFYRLCTNINILFIAVVMAVSYLFGTVAITAHLFGLISGMFVSIIMFVCEKRNKRHIKGKR